MNLNIFITVSIFLFFISNVAVLSLRIVDPPEGINQYVENLLKKKGTENHKGFLYDFNPRQILRLCQRFMVKKNISFLANTEEDMNLAESYDWLMNLIQPTEIYIDKKGVGQRKMIACTLLNPIKTDQPWIRFWIMNDIVDNAGLVFKAYGKEMKAQQGKTMPVKPHCRILDITKEDYDSPIHEKEVADWVQISKRISKEYKERRPATGGAQSHGLGRGQGRGRGGGRDSGRSSAAGNKDSEGKKVEFKKPSMPLGGSEGGLRKSIGDLKINPQKPERDLSSSLSKLPGDLNRDSPKPMSAKGGLSSISKPSGSPEMGQSSRPPNTDAKTRLASGLSKPSLLKPSFEEDDEDDEDDSTDSTKLRNTLGGLHSISNPSGKPGIGLPSQSPDINALRRPVPPTSKSSPIKSSSTEDDKDDSIDPTKSHSRLGGLSSMSNPLKVPGDGVIPRPFGIGSENRSVPGKSKPFSSNAIFEEEEDEDDDSDE